MKLVILAAGRGTRMGDITRRIPKPMLPVAGMPAVERVIRSAAEHGFRNFVVVTGYLAEQVRGHLRDGSQWGVHISCVQQDEQNGTASALLLTENAVAGDDLLLGFADIMTSPENYARMRDAFYAGNCDVVGALRHVDDPWRAAAVYVDTEMNIERMVEKPPPGTSTTHWAHAGMYCFRNEVFRYLRNVQPSARGEYEVTDAVAAMITDKKRVRGVELTGYWKDLATLDDLRDAEELIADEH
jgi:dTDP-glucose pyrophosphorylase